MPTKFSAALAASAITCAALIGVGSPATAAGTTGNKPSYGPDVSSTGRFVVFASDATNLVAGDVNGRRDIFIRDTQAGTTRLVSKGLNGRPANNFSVSPSVSADGRYVVFGSSASNLVPGDTNGKADIFRADMSTGKIVRVSVGGVSTQANGASVNGKVSGNGTLVAFASDASNLVARDTNGVTDVFVRDLIANTTKRISVTGQGNQNVYASTAPSISPNGSLVVFVGPVGLHDAVYQWNRATGKTVVAQDPGNLESVRASNGGAAWADWDTDGHNYYYMLHTTASPTTDSFHYYDPNWDAGSLKDFDVSQWGAMAVYAHQYGNGMFVVDRTSYDPASALGALSGNWSAVAFSNDGSTIVARNNANGQIVKWLWRLGSYTTVSTN
ncbi:hypothetical protein [Nostocoides veronense]|uniref:Uncharacterized protein n=1 Tax=Nostocoides veronense TaxID=330836 RepID=A0ABN2LEW5_9MICO